MTCHSFNCFSIVWGQGYRHHWWLFRAAAKWPSQGRISGEGAGGALWFIGVEAEQEMSAPPPKKNPGSAPASAQASLCWREAGESTKGRCMENNGKRKEKKTRGSCLFLILIVHLCLLFSFIVTIFIKMRTCSLCEGESKVSITETCILYGHNNINNILIMYTDSLVIIWLNYYHPI